MMAALRILALALLGYFCLLGLFGALTWIKFIGNVSRHGGEMAGSLFLLGLLVASGYYGLLTVWAFNLYKKKQVLTTSTFLLLGFPR